MSLDVNAAVLEVETAECPAAPALADLGDVLINIRFFPDGTVNTIDNCPKGVGKEDWFRALCRLAPFSLQTFAGGRGHYRLPFAKFQEIVTQVAA